MKEKSPPRIDIDTDCLKEEKSRFGLNLNDNSDSSPSPNVGGKFFQTKISMMIQTNPPKNPKNVPIVAR